MSRGPGEGMDMEDRELFMSRALELAGQGRGLTAPNPCVGAVLVRDGQVVAEGWHRVCGGPHAEAACLDDARRRGVNPAGCAMYVTLEPCNHFGRTPPCARAVLAAGVGRVVIGCLDPNPDVTGGGADFLRQNGVAVEVGVLEERCRDMIADFVIWKTTSRTSNVLKLAATLDGRIATRTGHSAYVSGEASRRLVHELRTRVGAVVVGAGTFRIDDPSLTHRLGQDSEGRVQPLAVVVGRSLPDARESRTLLRQRAGEAVFWTSAEAAASDRAEALLDLGARVYGLPMRGERLDLGAGFERLRAEAGVYLTLCEGGSGLASSLLEQGLMDELWLFVAPKILGDEAGAPLFSGRRVLRMDQAVPLRPTGARAVGQDWLLTYR